ncbi:uncharacterized protein MONOS_1523 [Monocercomonoides exilis]|uniref:uncharacterized protein n=1 Tax=Monocercomonoides exilis TaxID=2049356 RepID=UPI00355A10CC|nr:hypothetical protein MONOS_1523 [Monocercomonoides exilis]|eukprot:MONOS_1523.1-p1 / transcript=MONOS_1523.1 / gene=MONOS_1523 / organism=Monocercomonoides_exilis_PA203 / gene_product=unspecified product / transcript_product=unspecified product / location=Mono_scaffold00027:58504-67219(+) / protein_length=2578 / sequence_SO=supercontig / SO=protein_coding / is_pseudo=false
MARFSTSAKVAFNIVALILVVVNCCNTSVIAEKQNQRETNLEMPESAISVENSSNKYYNKKGIGAAKVIFSPGDRVNCARTNVNIINASLCVSDLAMEPLGGCAFLSAQHHSSCTIFSSTCKIHADASHPLFLSSHSSLSLTNFSLFIPQPAILSFPLFSIPNNLLPDAHSPIPTSFSISHSSFSSFISLHNSFLFSPSSSSSSSLLHRHLQIHLSLHLSDTLFTNITTAPQSTHTIPAKPTHTHNSFTTTTNTNTNTIPFFSLHSSLSIHSTIFFHTHNPIDGAILPDLNSPTTSLSAFNASFLHQTRSSANAAVVHVGTETQRAKPGRLTSFDVNSHRFEWCEWNDSNGGSDWGGALKVNRTNANLTITSCSFNKCSTYGEAGALYCGQLLKLNIEKSNFTSCSAAHGGAARLDNPQSSSCISNSGGDSAGSLTFHSPPQSKPEKFLVNDCQFISNKLISSSTSWGGAALCCTATFSWMSGNKFITFCFFDGNTAKNGRGSDVFFNGNSITQSPFENCVSTTPSLRVWNQGTADNETFNSWLPLVAQNKVVANNGTDADVCGRQGRTPCATIEYALDGFALMQDASLTLLSSTFVPNQTLTFIASSIKITGIGTDATTIASSGIPQPPNLHSQSSQSTSSFSSFSSTASSSSPDPSASSALFQQTQGSLTVSALAIAHNSTNQITPILFHLSGNSHSLKLNTTIITGTTPSSSSTTTPLFFLTAGSLALNHTAITSLALNSQSIFHLTSLTAPLTLNSSNITHITSTATPTSCVLSSATSPALSLSLTNCTITNIDSAPQNQQTATNGGCISFASSAPANTFSVSDTAFSTCSVSEDTSSGGRGGALMIEFNQGSQVSESSFSITNIVFSENKASVGRDMYFVCESLVASVKEPFFAFMRSITEKDNSVVGHDRTQMFSDWDVNLFVFLDGYFSDTIYVDGTSGVEEVYCGLEKAPCLNVNYGMGRLKRSQNIKQEIILCANSSLNGCLDVGGMNVKAKSETIVGVECKREVSGSEDCILKSTLETEIQFIGIIVPSRFNRAITSVIESTTQNGELHIKNCAISVIGGKGSTIGFSLIRSTGKMVELDSVTISDVKSSVALFSISPSSGNMNEDEFRVKLLNCTMEACSLDNTSFDGSPLMISSSVLFESSNFSNIENKDSEKGGVAKVTLQGNEELVMKSTNASSCSLSSSNGKGGFLFLDCQSCLNEKPFIFDAGITFENNKAAIGKNVFILGKNLNSSVTNDSFNFDYSSMINDKTLFVGSDNFHSNKDLFLFLIPFSSTEIFISSEGFDVARCGSEEEPCFTMWKGMENMNDGEGNKTIQISGSTVVQDSFNVSSYQIKKSVKMGEEDAKAKLNFEKAIGSQLEYFMGNDVHLELTNIQLQLSSGFDNSSKAVISNNAGELEITGCSFHSEAEVNNGFECVFVDVIGGTVEVNDLSIESCNVGNSIFVIHDDGVSCHFVNIHVKSLNESGGCILSIKKSEAGLKINEGSEGGINLQIDKSSFSGVKRSDNGASILESKSENKICLVINESNITEGKAELGEKGGAIFFTLGASGSMKMIESTISHCSCNNSTGRGGGVYLATEERGFLNFTFVGMKFSANTAKVGNDIFIECFNITSQINERQFQLDLREGHYSRINAIYGIDCCEHKEDTDLIDFVTIHQSDTIIVSSVNGSNDRQCGTSTLPCHSIDYGLMHLTSDFISQMFIVEESVICEEINLEEMSLNSKSREMCKVEVKSGIERMRETLVTTTGEVSLLRVNFVFDSNFISSHESLISPEGGILEIMNCSFTSKQLAEEGNVAFTSIPFHLLNMEKGELQLMECKVNNLILHKSALSLSSPLPSTIDSLTICNSTIKTSLIEIYECEQLNMEKFHSENITVEGNDESLISCFSMKKTMQLTNCTIDGVSSQATKGKLMKVEDCLDVKMDSCIFDGNSKEGNGQLFNEGEEMCRWDGSLVNIARSSVMMKDTTLSNSAEGGITMSGGEMTIGDGRFENNNPTFEGYPSLRRNIICSDSGTLNVMSLKGGDGLKDGSSLWMLNDGCSFEGIVSERDSSFFIPVLEKTEVEGSVAKDLISNCGDEIEVSVCILFGNAESPSSTNSIILKNRSEIEPKGDERNVEGGKEGKSIWPLIVVILAVLFLIAMIISIVVTIRWRRAKNENKDLREIVNDSVKKDPKLIEMVTMEMSPEEQWRRAEREAEKKNEERIKKRINGKEMVHSESEEYLLSESGSTEYILGKDSNKIPDWALEKIDEKEEEETRKRTPSPSISSNCSTDSDSTFVRSESLCPTTSSMSNLVDAMACSSPHEKLIVDLRDSLFMLLHGRNEKKEMAIGSLKEREVTAAQILFWVANLALHSFDEMENPLQSLSNLSPHIVLFSEHMVICIAMHSDCSSDDSSDSSSISSSTVVTSASDDEDSLPSSAFEDDEDNRYECMRWKAPELLMNKKMGATKESVVFSIGMMLWECLTLQIPFGEYEGEVAGKKIASGERPNLKLVRDSDYEEFVESLLWYDWQKRLSLEGVKKELLGHMPAGAVMFTASDAISLEESENEEKRSTVEINSRAREEAERLLKEMTA